MASLERVRAMIPWHARKPNLWRVREPEASGMTDLALVTAVVTILVVRGALAAAGFPQVGGKTLHIAHLLWGGLLMVLAFGTLLQAADRVWKPISAFVFGIGLGLFLDETGKFITKNNDYFFKPAVAVMYVVLMALFLLTHAVDRLDRTPPQEDVYFAAQAVAHLTLESLTPDERDDALRRLDESGMDSSLVQHLRAILSDARPPADTTARLRDSFARQRRRLPNRQCQLHARRDWPNRPDAQAATTAKR